ncbi:MAG: hypothetical protein QM710_09575 [Flavobacterium sp.]
MGKLAMKRLVLFVCVLMIFSCGRSASDKTMIQTDTITEKVKKKPIVLKQDKRWYVDLVEKYVANSQNELVVCERKAGTIDWYLDNIEASDTAAYYIFKIGHTETDEGNTNPRFTASGWIYIDSLTQRIYEYDLPNEQLVLWKNK